MAAAWRQLRVSVPAWSRLSASGNTPSSGTAPKLGFSPTMPQ
jgi:hypothetical protein